MFTLAVFTCVHKVAGILSDAARYVYTQACAYQLCAWSDEYVHTGMCTSLDAASLNLGDTN